jgi:hypothetical protein
MTRLSLLIASGTAAVLLAIGCSGVLTEGRDSDSHDDSDGGPDRDRDGGADGPPDGPSATILPPEPGAVQIDVPAGRRFYTNPGTDSAAAYAAFPALINLGTTHLDGTRTSRILIGFSNKPDPGQGSAGGANRVLESRDEGGTWTPFPLPSPYVGLVGAVRLADADATMLSLDFDSDCNSSGGRVGCRWDAFHRWLLKGDGWSDGGVATVEYLKPASWARFHKGPILLGDGKTLLGCVYGGVGGAALDVTFAGVVRSTDDGRSWSEVHRLIEGPGKEWGEATIALTTDAALVAVFRRNDPTNSRRSQLWTARSGDPSGGGAWSPPTEVFAELGNSPSLATMGNGALVVGLGRPDNWLAFGVSGIATDAWTAPALVYRNAPSGGSNVDAYSGSSGTVPLAPLDAHRVLVVGDNCAAQWGCPAAPGGTGYTVDRSQSLWKTVAEIDTEQWGKLDLATMFRRGEVAYLGASFVGYGRGRLSHGAYAFDGDARNDGSVVTSDRVVALDLCAKGGACTYAITGLGVAVNLQGAADLTIETSLDGVHWTAPGRGKRAGNLRRLNAPTVARFVRVADPNPITDPTAAFVNELEVYTMTDGFENNLVGVAPVGNGLVAASNATVIEAREAPYADAISSRFLRLLDSSATASASIEWAHASAPTASCAFRVRAYGPQQMHPLRFEIMGDDGSGAAVAAYRFEFDNRTGRLSRYDATRDVWQPVGDPHVSAYAWNQITVDASATSATVAVNGKPVGAAPPTHPVRAMTGNRLSSYGLDTVGDYWLFDDVTYLGVVPRR